MKSDHMLIRLGCILRPSAGTAKVRSNLGIPCPSLLLVLGNSQRHGHRHTQVLITYPDQSSEVRHYRMKHLLECYEICRNV